MNCMKCGREFEGDQAFCPKCLELMAQRPVKHDVVIKLPRRQDASAKKAAPRKHTRTQEEQIRRLKRINIWLITALCLMTFVAGLLLSVSIDFFKQLDVQRLLGQNYSTVETSD